MNSYPPFFGGKKSFTRGGRSRVDFSRPTTLSTRKDQTGLTRNVEMLRKLLLLGLVLVGRFGV